MIMLLSSYVWQTKTDKRGREKNKKLTLRLVISIKNEKYVECFCTKFRLDLILHKSVFTAVASTLVLNTLFNTS